MISTGLCTDPQGAYYYYNWHQSAEYSNYQQAMEGVHEYAVAQDIPYKHILLDSWWCKLSSCPAVLYRTTSVGAVGVMGFARACEARLGRTQGCSLRVAYRTAMSHCHPVAQTRRAAAAA